MANYNFTFNNGSLTYKDADGNECSVGGGGGGAVYNIPLDENLLPTVSYNTIKQHFENGDICFVGDSEALYLVYAVFKHDTFYDVTTGLVGFTNTSPDASSGWDFV